MKVFCRLHLLRWDITPLHQSVGCGIECRVPVHEHGGKGYCCDYISRLDLGLAGMLHDRKSLAVMLECA